MARLRGKATVRMYVFESRKPRGSGKSAGFADKSVIRNSVTTMTMLDNRCIFTMSSKMNLEIQFNQTNVYVYIMVMHIFRLNFVVRISKFPKMDY